MIDLVFLISRAIVGLLMFGHGTQKLFGWFGGPGVGGTSRYFAQLGLRPARPFAVFVGLIEALGGLSLLLGLVTPVGAVAVAAVMIGAIVFAHIAQGIWNANGGFEYHLVMLAMTALLALAGPGVYSLDTYLALSLPADSIYLAGLALALVAVLLVRWIAGSQAAGQARPQTA